MKENIFAPALEIIDQARTMQTALTRMEQEERQITADYCALFEQETKAHTINQNFDKIRAARIAKENKLKENETAKTQIKIILRILHDNARIKAAETMKHYIAGILQKYAGKKPGPKTAEKIKESFYSATGCNLYFDGTGKFSRVCINADNAFFNYGEFEFYGKNGITTDENKITAHTADELNLSSPPTYCQDPAKHADEIIKAFQEIKAAEDEMQAKIKKFNEIIPSKLDTIHVITCRSYIVL